MVANAGLDNDKSQLTYQVELLKDRLEEGEEHSALVARELREKSREFELLRRSYAEAQRAVQLLQVSQLSIRSKLRSKYGEKCPCVNKSRLKIATNSKNFKKVGHWFIYIQKYCSPQDPNTAIYSQNGIK